MTNCRKPDSPSPQPSPQGEGEARKHNSPSSAVARTLWRDRPRSSPQGEGGAGSARCAWRDALLRWVFVFTDLLFPAQDVVFVGAILGAYARIDGFVRPGGPDHDLVVGFKLVIRISHKTVETAFRGVRVGWVLRNFRIFIKSVSRFIVIV